MADVVLVEDLGELVTLLELLLLLERQLIEVDDVLLALFELQLSTRSFRPFFCLGNWS